MEEIHAAVDNILDICLYATRLLYRLPLIFLKWGIALTIGTACMFGSRISTFLGNIRPDPQYWMSLPCIKPKLESFKSNRKKLLLCIHHLHGLMPCVLIEAESLAILCYVTLQPIFLNSHNTLSGLSAMNEKRGLRGEIRNSRSRRAHVVWHFCSRRRVRIIILYSWVWRTRGHRERCRGRAGATRRPRLLSSLSARCIGRYSLSMACRKWSIQPLWSVPTYGNRTTSAWSDKASLLRRPTS